MVTMNRRALLQSLTAMGRRERLEQVRVVLLPPEIGVEFVK